MIAITGATGKLGQLVIEALLKRVPANEIILAVRNPGKADAFSMRGIQVRQADYTQPETWETALAGVDKLLLISSPDRNNRVHQHGTVINAAKRAGVKLIVFTSLLHADKSKLRIVADFKATEQLILESGIPYVILRNAWYTENKTMFIGQALKQGIFPGAANEGRYSAATREDYAEAATVILTNGGHENMTYELAGDDSFSLPEFVAKVSELSGKKIAYKNLGEAAFAQLLMKFGIPQQNAEELAESEAGGDRGEHFDGSHDLSKLIGRPTTHWKKVIATTIEKTLRGS